MQRAHTYVSLWDDEDMTLCCGTTVGEHGVVGILGRLSLGDILPPRQAYLPDDVEPALYGSATERAARLCLWGRHGLPTTWTTR